MAEPLTHYSSQTMRQAGGLLLQRILELAAGFFTVALIPRAMGPDLYGQFSLVHTLSLWFSALSGMGAVSMMTRFVPEFIHRGDHAGLRKLAGGMMTLRMLNAIVAASVYFVLAFFWLRNMDAGTHVIVAVSIGIRTAATLPFTLFLGLNQTARWGVAELLRRLLMFPLVYTGYIAAGLRGACAGLLLIEAIVLALGLWWARDLLSWRGLRVDRTFLLPFIRFSAAFFVGNALIMMFQHGGEPLVKLLSGQYAEVGYYSIAFGAYLTGAHAVWKVLNAFGPLFSTLSARGEIDELKTWVERVLKLYAIVSVLAAAFAYACGPLFFRLVLGPGFEPVAPLIALLGIAGLWFGPGGIARLLAVTYNEPISSITGAALQLVAFGGLSAILVPRQQSQGACIAAIAATALFTAYCTWHIRKSLMYSMRQWGLVILVGAACSPLLWGWSGPGPLRYALFAVVFLASTAVLRIVTMGEFTALRRVLRRSPKPSPLSKS